MVNREQAVIEKTALVLKYFSAGEPAKAMETFEACEVDAAHLNSKKALGAVFNTKGILFYYNTSFDSALHYFKKALQLRKESGDHSGLIKTMSNIGGIYYMTMDYRAALKWFEDGLALEQKHHFKEGEFVSINNVASIYMILKMNTAALRYLQKAERIYIADNRPEHLPHTYDGMATVYKEKRLYDSALYYAVKTRNLAMKLNDQSSVAHALVKEGTIYSAKKDFATARLKHSEALDLALKLKDKRLQLATYANLAGVEIERNKPDSADIWLEKVMVLQEELKYKKNEEDLAKIFAEYYYRKLDYKKAYDYMMLYDRVRDSVYNLATTGQIAEMQERFEADKKEKQNLLLQAENRNHKTTRSYLLVILALALLAVAGAWVALSKIKAASKTITHQKELVEEKQKEILDSIRYAKRIQYALLASDGLLKANLPEHFVLFKPKDVVSGDFYWAAPTEDGFVYVTGDCTGHGVPGAFMSLLNISKLSQAINEKKITRPAAILNNIRTEIISALNPAGGESAGRDGMDAVVCRLNLKEKKLSFAAANNSFYIVRNRQVLHCLADKMPVGKGHDDTIPFTENEISLETGDVIYTMTDGYADQFGGPAGKKFKYRQLEELLVGLSVLPMHEQRAELELSFEKWRGNLEQVDDVCIIGVRIV